MYLTSRKSILHNVVMSLQANLSAVVENEDYLTKQIITYIGNKRRLLKFIENGISIVKKKLGKTKLDMFDVFSGSGIAARHFKQHSRFLFANDLELYSKIINDCYLSNIADLNIKRLKEIYKSLLQKITQEELQEGIISSLYAPKDSNNIKTGERVFYTKRNAMYIDTLRKLIESVDKDLKIYFLAPLLTEASIHANTSGVFKGFYKNRDTGIGQFGGSTEEALFRIKGDIKLPFPVFSNFNCGVSVFNGDANEVVKKVPEVDMAYLDPPYNQHPYGSNYFMLNLIAENKKPENISAVSGIPDNWKRSAYNKKQFALTALTNLVSEIKAKYALISFNSEGFITHDEMKNMLKKQGTVEVLETEYPTFRGCRNLSNRNIHVTEYLYLLEK
ncbi:restriction endonuclease subunit M [Spirochaetia bacterium]|nr:restriction endonuclease subunit M [Spirochaetia bacterium]